MAKTFKPTITECLKRQLDLGKTIEDTITKLEQTHCCSYNNFLSKKDYNSLDIERLKVIADASMEIECTNYYMKKGYKALLEEGTPMNEYWRY